MILPEHLANSQQEIKADHARKVFLLQVRTNIATEVYSKLIQFEYQKSLVQAVDEDDTYGVKSDDEPRSIPFRINMGPPATIAVSAANVLMYELGLITEQECRQVCDLHNQSEVTS